jgi:hypothetical protein
MNEETHQKMQVVWRGECSTADPFSVYESRPIVLLDESSEKHWALLQIFKFSFEIGAAEMTGPFANLDEARDAAQQMQRDFAPDPLADERAAAAQREASK